MEQKIIELDYEDALGYFDVDASELDALAELTEQEKSEFHMEVTIDHNAKTVTYSYGNFLHESEHLPQKGSGIDNTMELEDDYVGACEKLAEMGEDLGLGLKKSRKEGAA